MADKNAPGEVLNVRLTPDLVGRLGSYVAELQAQHPGMTVTKSSAIRTALDIATQHLVGKPAKRAKHRTRR